ncbi:ABC transporter permease [Gracilibacillus dipsosauri]|uniref:ABC transporter permease n=1 Tax=Gracilibacillus dipsosauri TaxID=178340 RepID=UPI00240A2BAD
MRFHSLQKLLAWKWRQSRVSFMIWGVSLVLITVATASAFSGLYQNEQERAAMAQTMENPAMTAMVGPGYGLSNYTNGAMMAHEMLLFTMIAFAVMSILMVSKQTRAEEEDGKLELIRALPVGRLSPLMASFITVSSYNIIIGLLIAFGLVAMNIDGIGIEGSFLYGITLACGGLIFTAITAIFAQLSQTARGTLGYSFTFLLLFYFIRAIGDVSNEALSLSSPLGLLLRVEVFVHNYWWPILITFMVYLILVAVAFLLNNRRDVGAGLIATKPGRKKASGWILSTIGLALRIQRTSIIAWLVAMLLLGLSYGSVFGDLEAFFENNEAMKQMLGSNANYSLTEQFITMLMVILAIFSTIPALITFLKIKGEEKKERLGMLLTGTVSRWNIVGVYYLIGILLSTISQFLAVYGLWISSSFVMEEPIPFINFWKAGMAYLPASWFLLTIALCIFGFLPKWTPIIWGYLVFSFIVVYLGEMLDLPEWLAQLSSYSHIPQLPVEAFDWLPIIVLIGLSLIGTVAGFIGFRKRDVIG